MQYQYTINKETSLQGKGLHTGNMVTLTLKPAPANFGYRFKRIDLPEQPEIKADVSLVGATQRSTSLEKKGVKLITIEHVLAALVGAQVDNVLIEVDAEEMPIMDGSAKFFSDAIEQVGLLQQEEQKVYFELRKNLRFYHEESDTEFIALPADDYSLTVMIDYDSQVLQQQYANSKTIKNFNKEIAPCRTFCFLHEIEPLLKHNLIKGGDLDNAIVFVDENKMIGEGGLKRLAEVFDKKSVEVRKGVYVSQNDLLYHNEPARHKLLDLIGDLSLAGMPIKAHIIANKPGHAANTAFAKYLKTYIRKNKHLIDAPVYDPTKAPLLDINQISALLPHRFPFLLIDKVIELTSSKVVALKNVTLNEPFFQGHFPNHPVMPGVLIVEAMAQAGGILVLNEVEDPENYVTYFLKIEQARFRTTVVPGDTLLFKLDLISPIRRGICEMKGVAYVGDKIVAEASLVAQVFRK